MAHLRFSDADRERFGLADEWIEFDPQVLTVGEAEALDAAGGDWTTYEARGAKALKGRLWLALHRSGVALESIADLDGVDILSLRSLEEAPGKDEAAASGPGDTPTSPTSA